MTDTIAMTRLDPADAATDLAVERLLEAARSTLGMDVAFVTRLTPQTQTFTHLAGDGRSFGWQPGTQIPAEHGYCQYVLSGELPNAIPDSRNHPVAARIVATRNAGIGSYAGIALPASSGRVYGALCVSSHEQRAGFTEAEVGFLHFLARLVADELLAQEQRILSRSLQRDTFHDFLLPGAITPHLQPIVALDSGRLAGVEALARFAQLPPGSPVGVFAAAASAGMGSVVELAAIRAALALLPVIPDGRYLSVNAAPATVLEGGLVPVLAAVPGERVVLELTEHAAFTEHAELKRQLAGLREHGVRIAVDDTGAGYASLHNILALAPDVIKLDLALVTGLDTDPVRRALVRALTVFAADCGATLVAEGIETEAELATLRELDVAYGQGYLLARPAPPDELDLGCRYFDPSA